tara:strand:- start:2509 stop:3189 length:681 start_codon:yes stop_codon:yes gene_type:complete
MTFLNFINQNIPFTYAKYGDGEYLVSINKKGQNCDLTPYTPNLSYAVIQSYKFLAPLKNSYIGCWFDDSVVCKFFENIIKPNWYDYCAFIFGTKEQFEIKLPLLKTIRNAIQQKIYICNENNSAVSSLFNIDNTIIVHPSNWFENDYDLILQQTRDSIINPDSIIIMTSAGMGAKPLLSDLRKFYPNAILIDIGSGFDLFVYKKSRSYNMHLTKNDIDEFIDLLQK